MFKTIDEAFAWIESFTNFEKKPDETKRFFRLERMEMLLEHWDSPQKEFKVLHLAGSKGKGSTATLLSGALSQSGFKTGLFTSPHILHYRERIRVNGESLSDEVYIQGIEDIKYWIENLPEDSLKGGDEPTTFELLTLLGFILFKRESCDWVVLETGLGGRLDATNTTIPEACLITPIEKEHTKWLGDTLEEIAFEKGGIIKQGVPVFCATQESVVKNVLKKIAEKRQAPFYYLPDYIKNHSVHIDRKGTNYITKWKDDKSSQGHLNMIGQIQGVNAAHALLCLKTILPQVKESLILDGMREAMIPGRMQIVSKDPFCIIDGAHTPNSLTLALGDFEVLCPEKNRVLLFACGDDKNAGAMAELAQKHFEHIVITSPGFFKKSHPEEVASEFEKRGMNVILEKDPQQAMKGIVQKFKNHNILTVGSFFLAGEISEYFKK